MNNRQGSASRPTLDPSSEEYLQQNIAVTVTIKLRGRHPSRRAELEKKFTDLVNSSLSKDCQEQHPVFSPVRLSRGWYHFCTMTRITQMGDIVKSTGQQGGIDDLKRVVATQFGNAHVHPID